MATSKYGVGKYGVRLYSTAPYVNYAASGSVDFDAAGLLGKSIPLSASGSIEFAASASYIRVRGYYATASIDVAGIANFWKASTVNYIALGKISIGVVGTLGLRRNFTASGSIVVSAEGNAYFGPFWNEKDCAPDTWNKEDSVVSPWINAGCATNTWSKKVDG